MMKILNSNLIKHKQRNAVNNKLYLLKLVVVIFISVFTMGAVSAQVTWSEKPSPCDDNDKRSISATITNNSANSDKFNIKIYNGDLTVHGSHEVFINRNETKTITLHGIPEGEFKAVVKRNTQNFAEKFYNFGTCKVHIQIESYTRNLNKPLHARVYVSAVNWDVRIKEIGLTVSYDKNLLEVIDDSKTWKVYHLKDSTVNTATEGTIMLTGISNHPNGFLGDRTMWKIPFKAKGKGISYLKVKKVNKLIGVDENGIAKDLNYTVQNGSVKYIDAEQIVLPNTDDIHVACEGNLINNGFNQNLDSWGVWYNKAKAVKQTVDCECRMDCTEGNCGGDKKCEYIDGCIVRGKVYMGKSALEISKGNADGAYYKQLFSYDENEVKSYSLSAYARYDILDLSGWAGIGVHYYNDAYQYIGQEAVGVYGEDWQHYQLDLEVPEETKWIRVWAYKTEPGTAYFDGMCFVANDNLISSNAGFEKGSNQQWYLPETQILSEVAGKHAPKTGKWAAVVRYNAQQGGGVYDRIEIDPSKNYTIKAFAKKAGNPTKAVLGVHYYKENGDEIPIKDLVDVTETNYQQYQVSFTPPANAKYIKPIFWKSGTGRLYVDDFRLFETPSCSSKKGLIWGYDNYSYLCDPPSLECKDPTLMNQFGVNWYVNVGGGPNVPFNEGETIDAEYFKATHRHGSKDINTYYYHFCYEEGVAELTEPYNIGFNEPDLETQADMTVDKAIEHWAHMSKFKGELGSPCTFEHETEPGGWFEQFIEVS